MPSPLDILEMLDLDPDTLKYGLARALEELHIAEDQNANMRRALHKIENARTGGWQALRREDQEIAFAALYPKADEAPNA